MLKTIGRLNIMLTYIFKYWFILPDYIHKYWISSKHFKDAVLPLDKELYLELIFGNDYKRCQSCGSRFYSKARNKRYCDKCAERIKRQKAAERKRRQRELQKQLLYINN